MPKWLAPVLIGFAVAALISFLLVFAAQAAGAKPDWTTYLPGFVFGVIAAYAANNLTGNRRVRDADAATRAAALSFTPDAAHARLYLVRTGLVGLAAGMNVDLDGRDITQLKSPRFASLPIAPGAHVVRAGFGGGLSWQTNAAELAFDAHAGELIALHLKLHMGALKNSARIERVAIATLQDQLRQMRMVAVDV